MYYVFAKSNTKEYHIRVQHLKNLNKTFKYHAEWILRVSDDTQYWVKNKLGLDQPYPSREEIVMFIMKSTSFD